MCESYLSSQFQSVVCSLRCVGLLISETESPFPIPQTQSAFHRHAQRNAFPSPRCASAIQIVRPLESTAETHPQLQPALLRLSAMISQHGNRLVRPLLTASSVIPVMPECMLMVPNPGSQNEWPVHCDRGIHCVWPFNLGAGLAIVVVFPITAHIPRRQNKPAKQHY
jgi:hypothetical protein